MTDSDPQSSDSLRRLAAVHGIAWDWHDVAGHRHIVPEASLRSLLAAMGVAAHDDAAVQESLRVAGREAWRRVLPAVHVARADTQPARVVLRLAEMLDDEPLELRLTREDGIRQVLSFSPSRLERLDAARVDGESLIAHRLELPHAPLGYHHIDLVYRDDVLAELVLIVTPERCFEPELLRGAGRVWGPTVQLYALRSRRNWGMGDFSDLQALLEQWAERDASFVGINPLHALFAHDPSHASPYSPSSRQFLNVFYLDPERIEDFQQSRRARALLGSAEFQTRLAELRAAELVDYPAVAELKLRVLEQLHASFRRRHLDANSPRAQAFRHFQQQHGHALELHTTFEALQERLYRADPQMWGWPTWPREYRDPQSPVVERFRAEQRERIELYQYLQWQADLQLAAIGSRAHALDMGVGLYGDLAVSADRGGAESWANQRQLATDASIGAPPDEFNPAGQDWGLPPLVPERLVAAAYGPFIALLRANMRHHGALRIDHVMGLERLYWVPAGASPADGAYVSYPLEDMLGILALESQRNSCLIIGEDLGTVSDTVRTALERCGVLSYRLLLFERHLDGAFKAPPEYPAHSLAAATTHDLPTLAGFWEGSDLTVRHELGQFPTEEIRQKQIVSRAQARAQLLLALEREQLLPEAVTVDPMSVPEMTPALVRAIHEFLARSPAAMLAVQLEDALGAKAQVNLPGTTAQHYPNWRRKLAASIEELPADERIASLSEMLNRARPRTRARRAHVPGRRATIPRATYRLQLNSSFTFREVTELVPYLADLGVSHLYCSPYFRARPGSTHGYDVVDHNSLNPEIGSREDFERLVAALQARGLGQILDIVPNHVGIMGAENAWWIDVLENGPASVYAQFFDIDWQPSDPALAGKVLVPVLGDQYGNVLERGELDLRFEREAGAFSVFYHEHRLPLDPRDYPGILERALALMRSGSLTDEERADFASLTAAFGHLPGRNELSSEKIAERHRDKEVHKRRLAALCARNAAIMEAVEVATRAFGGRRADGASFDALHGLLESQAYRLAYWRVASDEINYRRFFDINDLAALRMENEVVFEATHRLVLDLIADGKVHGLRVDHPDGLYDPLQYFRRLQERVGALAGVGLGAAPGSPELPIYLVVEKITAAFEHLPADWPVHGTTGYRFANVVNGLLVDAAARSRFDRAYRTFIGEPLEWDTVVYDAKRLIVSTSLAAELNVLANQLARIARSDRHTRDFTLNSLRQALAEIIACFPVYRTYVAESVSADDVRYIDWALACARRRGSATDAAVFDFVRSTLTEPSSPARAFAMKLQQLTAPATAKGVEDTALYRFTPLASLNEVGGEPASFGVSVRAFHADAQYRARNWPHEMLATSTHDTKRSEDVRARINVLSEMPGEWRRMLDRWSRMNRTRKREIDGVPAPSRNDEYLLYQSLLGSFPLEECAATELAALTERVEAYMIKAAREAKVHSSWANIHAGYEEALGQFVRALLEPREGNLFLRDLTAAQQRIARFGLLNSLSQTACKLTAPGVPDIYQGNELWSFSLVDPDNRRPVDYTTRRRMLDELRGWATESGPHLAGRVRALLENMSDGLCKLYLTWRALQLRRTREALFTYGDYVPLRVAGKHAAHLVAFARRHNGEAATVIVPRLYARLLGERDELPLGDVWSATVVELARGCGTDVLHNALDGASLRIHEQDGRRVVRVSEALAAFPVAILVT